MFFIQLKRIRIHLSNILLKFLSLLGVIKTGYDSEIYYNYIGNAEISKLIEKFKFWVDDDERNKYYNYYKNIINAEIPKINYLEKNKYYNELKKNGCVNLTDFTLSNDDISKIKKYLENKYLHLSHVVPISKYKTKSFFLAKNLSQQASYSLEDILKCKELLKIITNKKIIGLASDYFECTPTIGEINLYWTFPKLEDHYKNFSVRRYHRDVEDYKMLKFFINLTDTNKNDGGLKYIKKSNEINFLRDNLNNKKIYFNEKDIINLNRVPNGLYNVSELVEKNFKDLEIEFYSKKGSLFAVDHYGLHKAIQAKKPRLVMWITFHLSQFTGRQSYFSQNLKIQKRVPYSLLNNYIENNSTNSFIYKSLINFQS